MATTLKIKNETGAPLELNTGGAGGILKLKAGDEAA